MLAVLRGEIPKAYYCVEDRGISSMVSTGRDGHGLIGYGISMFEPLCAFACRDILSTNMLNYTETEDMSFGLSMEMASETSLECHATDDAFLETLACCMSTLCQDME